jgi:AcrR family transcriptional regulator
VVDQTRRKGGILNGTGPTAAHTPGPGRRERKKQETQRRIFEAANSLFAMKGYAAVTTQEVAAVADVGAGTLFRYAKTKAELLIMVMNERLRLGAERGLVIAERGGPASESIVGLIEPLVQAAITQPENTAVFQREVLFGVDGPYRSEALKRIRELEDAMVTILTRYSVSPGTPPTPTCGGSPARSSQCSTCAWSGSNWEGSARRSYRTCFAATSTTWWASCWVELAALDECYRSHLSTARRSLPGQAEIFWQRPGVFLGLSAAVPHLSRYGDLRSQVAGQRKCRP